MYDTRDFIPNPWRGVYVKLEQRVFPGFFGNKGAFSRTELQVDAYHQVWKGGVMAYDLYGVFNYGNTPWTMLALMGGSTRMRGYYEGRYRDKQMIEIQAELRQKIYGRSGIARLGGSRQRLPEPEQVQPGAYAAQLRDRLPLGVQKAGERPVGLRFWKEGTERISVQY